MSTKPTNNIPNDYVSKNVARKTTKILRDARAEAERTLEYIEAFNTAQKWRAQHALPAQECFKRLITLTEGFPEPVLSFRLKRMQSILKKLRRQYEETYQLTSMDDIGGCRIVLDDMDQVKAAVESVKRGFQLKCGKSVKDYISRPKESGYRSCHIITVNEGEGRQYRVEVQVRTKLQHIWSTAVESAGPVFGINLKLEKAIDSIGDEKERQLRIFFAIISRLFSLEEGAVQASGYERSQSELVKELKSLSILDEVLRDLSIAKDGISVPEMIGSDEPGFFLLRFSTGVQFLDVGYYPTNQLKKALDEYNKSEVLLRGDSQPSLFEYDDVVLAHAQNSDQLNAAFTNYSARLDTFLECVSVYL